MTDLLSSKKKMGKYNTIVIHTLLWLIMFVFPFFLMERGVSFDWKGFRNSLPTLISFMIVFYINYLFLIKKYLFNGKVKSFIAINILLIIFVASALHFLNEFSIYMNAVQPSAPRRMRRFKPSPMLFVVRNVTSLVFVSGLCVALKMSARWFQLETERKELEKAKSEAELQNLKNQINPHFLLNTLNNIYALVEFNPPKAQEAIMDLSKLLRHLLYENNQTYVPLRQEVDFINNYIELMRIRLAENVKLTTNFSLQEHGNTMISPLIFISLIENAFKHGVSARKPSFIDLALDEQPDHTVQFEIKNSYFPKSKSDMSGSGIGLELVKKRLELLYPNHYSWSTRIDNEIYTTKLIIDTKYHPK